MINPAETYERDMVPVLFGPWVSYLLDAAKPQPGEKVLDVACGTGIVARQVVQRVGRGAHVVGLDLSAGMLAVARSAADLASARIQWHEGLAEALPFPDGEFDLVLSQQGLQFFTDRPRAVAEMFRVLRDGGRVALSVWRGLDHHPFFSALNDVIVRQIGIPALASPFSLGEADDLRALLTGAGFRDVAIEAHSRTARFPNPDRFIAMEVDVLAAAVPSMQHLDAAGREELAGAIAGEMVGPIRELTQDDHLVIPCHSHVAVAHHRSGRSAS